MNKLLYKLKNNKLLAGFVILISAIGLYDLFVIVFDVIQIITLSKNSVNIFGSFVTINILAGVFNIIAVVAILIYLIFSRRTLKSQINVKTKSR